MVGAGVGYGANRLRGSKEKESSLRGVSTNADAPLGGSSQEPQLTGQRFRVLEFTAGAEHHPINARWAHVCWGAHDAVPLSSSVHTTSPLACTLVVNRRRAARIRLSTLCTDLLIEMWHAARCPCKHTYHEGRTSTQGSNAITPRASLQDMPAFATARPWVGSKAYKTPSKMVDGCTLTPLAILARSTAGGYRPHQCFTRTGYNSADRIQRD